MSETKFKEVLKARLLPALPKNVVIQIEMVDSSAVVNIQIADWVAGALARYLEKGKLGEECFKILKGNIIGEGKGLFNGESVI